MTGILIVGGLLVAGAILYFARKGGKDAVRADVAETQVEKTIEANKPVTDSERADVVSKYERR